MSKKILQKPNAPTTPIPCITSSPSNIDIQPALKIVHDACGQCIWMWP